jgi:tetratricopeptide (TPR) repeat protein
MYKKMKRGSLFSLFAAFFLLQGCGYSLKMVDADEPSRETESRREAQNKKEFDDTMQQAARTKKITPISMKEEIAQLQLDVKQLKEDNQRALSPLHKKLADVDLRLDDTALQIRLIQGNIEKEGHQVKELFHQVDNISFRVNDLIEIKGRLGEQEKKWDFIQKTLQEQINSIKVVGSNLQKSSEQQAKKLEEMSDQVLELAEKVPPALNAQAVQLNDLGKQFEKMTKGSSSDQVSKSLVELSDALNVLGQKITAKVDEQEQLLQKTTKRLQALETKLSSGKRSSFSDGEQRPLFSEIYYELGAGYYELNEITKARESFERARQISEVSTAGFDRILPVYGSGIE